MRIKVRSNLIRICLIVILCVMIIVPVSAKGLPNPTERFYINDYAKVLSEEQEDLVYDSSKSLYNESTAQIAVLIVESLDGADIKEYANDVFRKWGIGTKDKNNGVLILLATEDRKIRIEVGYGLEGALTDTRCGQLLDNVAIPYLKEDKFDEGILHLYYAVLNEVRDEYELSKVEDPIDYSIDVNADSLEEEDDSDSGSLSAALFLFVGVPARKSVV